MDLGGWGSEEGMEEVGEGNCNQNILYEKTSLIKKSLNTKYLSAIKIVRKP